MLLLRRRSMPLCCPFPLTPLFLVVILFLSCAAADAAVTNNTSITANATIAANNTSTVDDKASFICNYDDDITRVITIDKSTDGIKSLRAQIATFFPGKPTKFKIQYVLPDDENNANEYVPPRRRFRNYVDVVTDEDVRNLMAKYEAYARASPNPVRIDFYVTVPHWWKSDWFIFPSLLSFAFIYGVFISCVLDG